jgi:hypothetical protein
VVGCSSLVVRLWSLAKPKSSDDPREIRFDYAQGRASAFRAQHDVLN